MIKYLVGVLEIARTAGMSFDIGGRDVLSYQEMMGLLVKILQRRKHEIDRKDRRDELHVVFLAGGLNGFQAAEKLRRLFAERIQAERNHRPVQAVLRPGLDQFADLAHVGVFVQVPTENPHEAVGEFLGCLGTGHAAEQRRHQASGKANRQPPHQVFHPSLTHHPTPSD